MAKIETTLPASQVSAVGSLFKEEYQYVGSQDFTTVHNYSQVYSVEVTGVGALSESQYSLLPPNTVHIIDPLEPTDFVVIIYGQGSTGVSPYYTQAETQALLANQTEYSNELFKIGAKVYSKTGITSKNDNFELVVFDANTATIKAVDAILFYEELFTPNVPINLIVRSFPEINYPLSELAFPTGFNVNINPITSDGIYVRYIGYDVNGNVYSSATNFEENSSIAQLGILMVINTLGIISFLDMTPGARNAFSVPILACTDDLQRTITTPSTTVTINYNIGFPTLKANPGVITGLSINWKGLNNPGNTSPIDKLNYFGDDTIDFVSIDPNSLIQTTPFTIHTLWTETEFGIQINESFYNTTSTSRDTLDLGSYGIKRVLIGVRGGFFIQEPEFATSAGYLTLNEARANVLVHEFSDAFLPIDTLVEVARIIYLKSVTDFSDDNAFIIVTTVGGGGGGGASTPVSDATTVSKGIVKLAGDLGGTADLPTTPTALHITGNETKTGSLTINTTFDSALVAYSTNNVAASVLSNDNIGLQVLIGAASITDAVFIDHDGSGNLLRALSPTATFRVDNQANVRGTAFIKTGGLPTQFLKADGTVDSTSYQPLLTNPITGTLTINTIPKASGSSILTNSNLSDDGTIVSTTTDMSVNGVRIGRGNNNLVGNTTVGNVSLTAVTTGNFNTSVGYQSSRFLTSGNDNTSVGTLALTAVTSGSGNTAIGGSALEAITTGVGNTSIGYLSLLSIGTSSSNNTAIGRDAGRYIADGSTPLTNSTQSTYLGAITKAFANSNTNETVIGYGAIGAGSDSVTLGNTFVLKTILNGATLINGKLSNTTSQLSIDNSEGGRIILRAGIQGLTNAGFSMIKTPAGGGTETNLFNVTAANNFLIGTDIDTGEKLQVGNNGLTTDLFLKQSNTTNGLRITWDNNSGNAYLRTAGAIDWPLRLGAGNNAHLSINTGGNVLIGLTVDNNIDKLQVNGSVNISNGLKYTKALNLIDATDLDTIIDAGFYNGTNLINAPTTGYYYITVESYTFNINYIHQTATSFGSGNIGNKIYTRVRSVGIWGPWAEILTSNSGLVKTRKDITGTTYTLLDSDIDNILYTTNASPVTITVPSGLTPGFEVEVLQYAAGQVSFVTSGTTLRFQSYELASTAELYSRVTISWIDTETYQLLGQLSMI